jgi:hypothetical protein
MNIKTEFIDSEPVKLLCDMYTTEYMRRSVFRKAAPQVPSVLNAIGACAGFAAQFAVWRELILPRKRNPGDFLVYATTKSHDTFFLGDAINLFLFSTMPDRLSFLSLPTTALSNVSEIPDISELVRHVSQTLGGKEFGRPRVPPSVELPELPQAALAKTWGKVRQILQNRRPAEWPALLGAAAFHIVNSNRNAMPPPIAIRILLEAAVPMSKLDPMTVEHSGVTAPPLNGWSNWANQPENYQEILSETRAVMPTQVPAQVAVRPFVINQPKVVFLNLNGTRSDAILAKDRAEIGGLFREIPVTATPLPACDVVFLYCAVESSGKVVGHTESLRNLIGESGTRVAVVASEIPHEILMSPEFQRSLNRGNNPPTNLVITGNRNGEAFDRFFKSLFQLMWAGVPMPFAWAKLAPQSPQQPPDIPGTICLMEAGHVVFGRAL